MQSEIYRYQINFEIFGESLQLYFRNKIQNVTWKTYIDNNIVK